MSTTPAQEVKLALDNLGTLGTIKIGSMEASPDVLGAIYEYGGAPTEGLFGVVGVGYENPALQIMFRGIPFDYAGPMEKARIAWAFLAAVQPGTISTGSATYLTIKPQQSPRSLGRDKNERYEIVCNFYARKEP